MVSTTTSTYAGPKVDILRKRFVRICCFPLAGKVKLRRRHKLYSDIKSAAAMPSISASMSTTSSSSSGLMDMSMFTMHSTVKSALKRLSVHLSHRHHASVLNRPVDIISPPSKRMPRLASEFRSPSQQQLDVIDLVCMVIEDKMRLTEVIEDPELLCFQASKRPEIALRNYIIRLVKYANSFCEDGPRADSSGIRSLLIAMELLNRAGAVLNARTVHRYLATAMCVAIKSLEDFVLDMTYWSSVAGCTKHEMELYERQFCNQIKFRVHVTNEQFNQLNREYGCPFYELDE
ncbi:hypothetical protein BASA81_001152 [Batrachochytrium salamandrivorans]|nr:hypothetical protein BASA81_001152 [Batrachochytrium salamandrivorans]